MSLAASAATLLLVLAGCTAGTAAGHGESGSALSSASDVGTPIAPASLSAIGSPTATTTANARSPAVSRAPGGAATTASAPGADPTVLGESTWLLVRAVVAGALYDSPQPPGSSEYSSYTVQFVNGQLVANDGCNTLDIAVTADAKTVSTSGDLTSTGAACPESALRNAYDRELFMVSLRWKVSGGRLTLTTHVGDTFEFEPLPPDTPPTSRG